MWADIVEFVVKVMAGIFFILVTLTGLSLPFITLFGVIFGYLGFWQTVFCLMVCAVMTPLSFKILNEFA